MNNTFTSINYLQWIDLMESFYKFKHEAEKITFYPNEIKDGTVNHRIKSKCKYKEVR